MKKKNNISDIYGTDGTLCCLFWDGTGNGFRNIIFSCVDWAGGTFLPVWVFYLEIFLEESSPAG